MTTEKSNLKTPKRISAGYLNAMGCPFIEVGKLVGRPSRAWQEVVGNHSYMPFYETVSEGV
jgi:hypothetical protein